MPVSTEVDAEAINLSDPSFWDQDRAVRFASFRALRDDLPVSWQPPPAAWAPRNDAAPHGYWAVTRYDDVRSVHRDPQMFLSGDGVMLYDNLDADRPVPLRRLDQPRCAPAHGTAPSYLARLHAADDAQNRAVDRRSRSAVPSPASLLSASATSTGTWWRLYRSP